MPTITYNYEPTDEVYIIDYCNDLKVEAVVKGTIYRVEFTVNTKAVDEVVAIAQVPTDAEIAASAASAASALIVLNNRIVERDAATVAATNAQNAVDIQTPITAAAIAAEAAAQIVYDDAVVANNTASATLLAASSALADAQAALDADPTNPLLIQARDDAQVAADAADAANIAAGIEEGNALGDLNTAALATTTEQATQDSLEADKVDADNAVIAAQAAVDLAQIDYDGFIADQVITTEAVVGVTPVDAVIIPKYILRTAYNESVSIEDESLIFDDKTAAFVALEARTA